MAKKRKSTPRAKRKGTTSIVRYVATNAPRPRHKRRKSNPPALSVAGVMGQMKDGAIGAGMMVFGEGSTRLARSRVFGMEAGETMSSVVEILIATALGLGATYVLPRGMAIDITKGGYAGVLRSTLKQLGAKAPIVLEALGDAQTTQYVIRNGRVLPANSPEARALPAARPAGRLNGYVGGGGRSAGTDQLSGYVAGSAMVNGS